MLNSWSRHLRWSHHRDGIEARRLHPFHAAGGSVPNDPPEKVLGEAQSGALVLIESIGFRVRAFRFFLA